MTLSSVDLDRLEAAATHPERHVWGVMLSDELLSLISAARIREQLLAVLEAAGPFAEWAARPKCTALPEQWRISDLDGSPYGADLRVLATAVESARAALKGGS
jgi:hypothetical protein